MKKCTTSKAKHIDAMEVFASVFAIVGVAYFMVQGFFGVAAGIILGYLLSRWQARCSLSGGCSILHNVIWAVFLLVVITQVLAFNSMRGMIVTNIP